jgi:hypothetical protein
MGELSADIAMESEIKIEAVAELTVAIEIERHPEDPTRS